MPPPPSALCPHPAPRPRLLKGRRGVRVRCLGRHLQEVFPAPALCPARGPPASPRADSRRDGLTGSRAKVLSRQPGRSGQRAPRPAAFVRAGLAVPRARAAGPALRGAVPQHRARPLHNSRRRAPGPAPCVGGNRRLRGERACLGHTSHELWWGSPRQRHSPSSAGDIHPCRFRRKATPKQRSPAHPARVCSPPPRLLRVRPPHPADHCGNTSSRAPGRCESRVGTNTGNYTVRKCWAGSKLGPATHCSGRASWRTPQGATCEQCPEAEAGEARGAGGTPRGRRGPCPSARPPHIY